MTEVDNLVSVIVPTYNHEKYVLQALQSIYEQNHENIELIVIDDCSTDATYEVVKKWRQEEQTASRFRRIILGRNRKNLGAHNTINLGLKKASGNWLTILNSDDYYAPERIKKLLQAADKTKRNFLFSKITVVDDKNNIIDDSDFALECQVVDERLGAYPSTGFAFLEKNIAITTGNFFFSRELHERVGDFAPLKYIHDWDYAIRALALEEPVLVDDELYFYRMHDTNSFKKLKVEQFLETQILYRRYFQIVKERNFENILFPVYQNITNRLKMDERKNYLDIEIPKYSQIRDGIEYQVNNE